MLDPAMQPVGRNRCEVTVACGFGGGCLATAFGICDGALWGMYGSTFESCSGLFEPVVIRES